MTADETRDFAARLMRDVWLTFDHTAAHRFYLPDVVGHHHATTIGFQDIVDRLKWDVPNFVDPAYDIREIVAEADKFAIRFLFTCTLAKTGERRTTEVNYFYRLRQGKISEFWVLSDVDFEYKQRL